jgi:outer membrane protein OmpA-like peptidoglycan-associated protein
MIATLRSENFGGHLYSGYMSNGDSRAVLELNPTKSRKEYPVGAGLDFSPSYRTRTTIELTAADASSTDAPMEATAGFQYYITPHLTFNLGYSMGLNDAAADWRVLFGLSTCQGVGAYIKPIPVVRRKGDKGDRVDIIKPTKIVILSPLLIKTPVLTTPVNKFEIPVDSEGEEILIRPYANVVLPQQPVSLPKPAPAEEVTPLYGVTVKGQVEPIEKLATPVTVYKKFRLPDNLFEFDNAELVPEVQKSVTELAEFIRKDTKWVFLRIDGHTDAVGSVKYNMDLSLKRAISVANYLIAREGIDPARIFLQGMGKSVPIADNSTDEGRKLNRRIEIVFLVHKEEKAQ